MRILVFDDNETHRAAAKVQLKGHDLTVVGTYDEAQKLLTPRRDDKMASAILKNQFGDFNLYRSDDEAKKAEYLAAAKVARERATTYPDFDVVLTDLLVPASGQHQGYQRPGFDGTPFVGQEMPVGIFIGLLAAVRAHAKYVAVFTDSNHHVHPSSACFDAFNHEHDDGEGHPTAFTVVGSKVILCNNRGWVDQFDPQDLSKPLEYEEFSKRSDTVRAKNWAALLDYLVNH